KDKIAERSKRFGTTAPAAAAGDEGDKKNARAARFGIPVAVAVAEDSKKTDRAKRFGTETLSVERPATTADSSKDEARKAERKTRFGGEAAPAAPASAEATAEEQ
ncbi:unnamed protein product, partial [Polarella glacialis]